MLLAKLKINRDVVSVFKYTEKELKSMGLPERNTKFKKIAAEAIAEAAFREWKEITSIFFVDTLNESLEGIWETCR